LRSTGVSQVINTFITHAANRWAGAAAVCCFSTLSPHRDIATSGARTNRWVCWSRRRQSCTPTMRTSCDRALRWASGAQNGYYAVMREMVAPKVSSRITWPP